MDGIIVARALHVLGVVIWIGGVGMVTTVVLPAIRRDALGADRLAAFQAIERRFVWQARAAVIVVGLSGFYMLAARGNWGQLVSSAFWWVHAMIFVWLLFAFMLFIVEPLVLHRRLRIWATTQPDRAFAWLHRAHCGLLTLSLVTILGAVAGSHGWSMP